MTGTSAPSCPRCGAAATGKFCAACGAALGTPTCLACGTTLAAGARFCHRCGAAADPNRATARGPAGTQMTPAGTSRAPWLIAAVLVVMIIAGVLYSANRRAAPDVPSMANAGNAGTAVTGLADNPNAGCVPTGPAPDISKLTPKERFVRLVDRINGYLDKNDTACVITFTPMALGAYANLAPADRDIDAQYHAAMLQAQVGMLDNARALADTIMAASPGNLFGYYIRATAAEFAGDSAAAKAGRAAFQGHYDVEIKKNRPEYTEHRPLLEQYHTSGGGT